MAPAVPWVSLKTSREYRVVPVEACRDQEEPALVVR